MQFRKQNKQINFTTYKHSYNLLLNTTWTVFIILAPLRKLPNKTNYYIEIPQKDTEPANLQAKLFEIVTEDRRWYKTCRLECSFWIALACRNTVASFKYSGIDFHAFNSRRSDK